MTWPKPRDNRPSAYVHHNDDDVQSAAATESNGDSQLSAQPDLGAEADVTMVMECSGQDAGVEDSVVEGAVQVLVDPSLIK